MKKVEIFSPAKINLTLDVLKKEPGAKFHEIRTIFHKLNLGDEIEIKKVETRCGASLEPELIILGDFDCMRQQNLIYKTWNLLPADIKFSAKVSVTKNIPTQAGLGGGSSNAAYFLKGYCELFDLNFKDVLQKKTHSGVPLREKLSELGKDILFFLNEAACALGSHFGEVIHSVDFNFSGQKIFLYVPDFGNNTAKAYQALTKFDTDFTDQFLMHKDINRAGNTFDQLLLQSQYQKLKLPSHIHLSGSGSVFWSLKKLDILGVKVIETYLV